MSRNHKRSQKDRKEVLWKLLFNSETYGKCCFCNKKLMFNQATVEHVIPLGEGGSNKFSNLNVSCPECNHRRSKVSQVRKCADKMAKRLYDMCKGKKEVSYRWKTLVDAIKSSRVVTLENCKKMYLQKKGIDSNDKE